MITRIIFQLYLQQEMYCNLMFKNFMLAQGLKLKGERKCKIHCHLFYKKFKYSILVQFKVTIVNIEVQQFSKCCTECSE